MSDPRNVAHDKKVKQEKEHHEPASGAGAKSKKGRKKTTQGGDQNEPVLNQAPATEAPKAEPVAGDLEKSTAVLSKLKEMEFHARANIETLAGLILTIDDELKQKEFSDPIGAVYAAQDGFRTQIAGLIEKYEAKCESLKPSA